MFVPLLLAGQNKPVVGMQDEGASILFTHNDSSKTSVPKDAFGWIFSFGLNKQALQFNIKQSGQAVKTISVIANSLAYPVTPNADSLLNIVMTWLGQNPSGGGGSGAGAAQVQMDGIDTLSISNATSLTFILESGTVDVTLDGVTLTYSLLGAYSWSAATALPTFTFVTGSGDRVKILTL